MNFADDESRSASGPGDARTLRADKMRINWVQAYGEYQLPFTGAATRALKGDWTPCPKCNAELRGYFHVFKSETGTGTFWLWCAACGTHTTLPRVKPTVAFMDPFSEVARGDFGGLEIGADERFLDRLERMWSDRILGLQHAGEIPEAILRAHPDLAAVGEALAQWRRHESISARCLSCQRVLQVILVEATRVLVVSCPGGHTDFRARMS